MSRHNRLPADRHIDDELFHLNDVEQASFDGDFEDFEFDLAMWYRYEGYIDDNFSGPCTGDFNEESLGWGYDYVPVMTGVIEKPFCFVDQFDNCVVVVVVGLPETLRMTEDEMNVIYRALIRDLLNSESVSVDSSYAEMAFSAN